jgi:hypothetical protein
MKKLAMVFLVIVRVLASDPTLKVRNTRLKKSHYRPYNPLFFVEGARTGLDLALLFIAPPLAYPLVAMPPVFILRGLPLFVGPPGTTGPDGGRGLMTGFTGFFFFFTGTSNS